MLNRKNHIHLNVVFLDNETIQYHDSYYGKRISRGLFKTKENHYINADINGSLNILKKYLNVASNIILNEGSRGLVVSPDIITLSNYIKQM